jgi:hypothetical protein
MFETLAEKVTAIHEKVKSNERRGPKITMNEPKRNKK